VLPSTLLIIALQSVLITLLFQILDLEYILSFLSFSNPFTSAEEFMTLAIST
jgi:hypothetical protein